MSKMFFKSRVGLLAAAMFALAGSLTAAPFDKNFDFTQPDGTVITLHGCGDEFSAVFYTTNTPNGSNDGYTVVFDQASQAYCFAQQSEATGQLQPTGVQAHLAPPSGMAQHVRMSAAARKQQVIARWQKWESAMQVQTRWRARLAGLKQVQYDAKGGISYAPPGFTTTGTKVGLTLLIDFTDDLNTIPQAEIINYCNSDNYSGFGNNGSVKKYFYDNSGGQLTYSNVVTIYVTAPQPKTYYNDTTKDCGDQANLLIKDALDTLKARSDYASTILPTFSGLTTDGGDVVAFNVFYAGGNGGVWTYGLWPHSWGLYNVGAQPLGNGMNVFRYQITDIGNRLTIGTFCHENGHMLCGYPDIYDYDYDSVGGAGVFCLMDYGGTDYNPSQICAYLKRASGWGNTVELDATSALLATAGAAATTGTNINQFYRYQKPGVSTEYYLMENRQKLGRDAGIAASGLAIWHVDELGDRDNQSTNYNTSHANYEVSLMQADNLYHFQNNINGGDANDLYYASNSAVGYTNAFADNTSPGARWWDGTASGLQITKISSASTNMTFVVGNYTESAGGETRILAPERPWGTNLSVFNSGNPNGDWYLFIQDDQANAAGVVSNGWYLTLTTASTVGYSSDNAVSLTPSLQTNVPGGLWTCLLSVTNYGPSISSNIYVTDNLPAGVSFDGSVAGRGTASYDGTNLVWSLGQLAVNDGATLTLKLRLLSEGAFTNVAVVASASDLNPNDDTAQAVMLVNPAEPPVLSSVGMAGGAFQFQVSGNEGAPVIIQSSTNLLNWVNLHTNISPFIYTTTSVAGGAQEFYRAVVGQ
jgi:M6 family metalloprotease-like protein/uncharacterized repeat protein (TIGR01451 family)